MNLIFRLIILCTVVCQIIGNSSYAQEDSISPHKRSFGYGVSNLIELYDFKTYTPGLYLEFGQQSSLKGWDYSIRLIGQYSLSIQNNIRTHSVVPFIVTLGLEKKWRLNKFILSFDGDLFYSMSLRKATLGTFQGDDYGVGISPGLNLAYPFRENLSIQAGLEYGVGFFREFVSVGSVTVPAMVFNFAAVRSFSLGIRHYF
ncbi:MAG: hypothetical protein H6599_11305 [Flavobacteriales bacterium]|nr:hypothetical protein [Flavobacteriales bacterium]